MLVLTRKIGQKILMGHNVNIVFLGLKGNQIRLGIEAPESLDIVRAELLTCDSRYLRLGELNAVKRYKANNCELFINQ